MSLQDGLYLVSSNAVVIHTLIFTAEHRQDAIHSLAVSRQKLKMQYPVFGLLPLEESVIDRKS